MRLNNFDGNKAHIAPFTNFSMLKLHWLNWKLFLYAALPIFSGLVLGLLCAWGKGAYALGLVLLVPLALVMIARPFTGVILWLALMPLSSALPNQELCYWVIHRILLLVTFVLLVLARLQKPSRVPRSKFTSPDLFIISLAILVPITILSTNRDWYVPIKGYTERMLIPFIVYFILRLSKLDQEKHYMIQGVALFIVISQSIIGALSVFAPSILPQVWLSFFQSRMSGSLLNPNLFGAMILFNAIILFQAAMKRQPDFIRTLFLVACGLSALCVFLSMERAVWLGGAAVILGLVFLYPKIMSRFVPVVLIAFVILGTGLLSDKITQASARINSQGQVNVRLALTDAMLRMITEKPLMGWGYGAINQYLPDFYRPSDYANAGQRFETSHNTYLTIFTELGLVGFLMYLTPFIWLLIASARALSGLPKMSCDQKYTLAGFWLIAAQQMIISNFMDMRFFPVGLTLWWMTLGFIARSLNQYGEDRAAYLVTQANQPSGLKDAFSRGTVNMERHGC